MRRFFVHTLLAGFAALALLVITRLWWECSQAPVSAAAASGVNPVRPKQPVSVVLPTNNPSARLTPSQATASLPRAILVRQPVTNPPAFAAFSTWAGEFLLGRPQANVARGEALAWKRREAMLELIQTNPRIALALAAPFRWHSDLPPKVARYLEQWVDARGAFKVAVATDFTRNRSTVYRTAEIHGKSYHAYVYGTRLAEVCQPQVVLHGIALDGHLALTADAVRILDEAEAASLEQQRGESVARLCCVCRQPVDAHYSAVAADIGGEVRYFCGMDHVRLVNEQAQVAASGGTTSFVNSATPANDAWTHGRKSLLYMRVNFPDDLTEPISEAAAYVVMDEVNAFYVASSYDLTAITTTVAPLVTVPETKAWYATAGTDALLADAREMSRQAGYDTANYDLDIVCFTSVPRYDFGGLAFVHGKGVWLQSPGASVTAHELGHNYGLWHANFWDTALNSSIIASGTNIEYGNIYDNMGSGGLSQFNAVHKHSLDWLPDSAVHSVATNGIYRIYPFEEPFRRPGFCYAAKARKDFQRDYWIEYRASYPDNSWLQNGLLLNWSAWASSKGGTDLLDCTPGTPTDNDSREDAALVIGRTFSDRAAGVHITPLQRNSDTSNVWFDVQFNLGQIPTNLPPSLKLEIDITNAAPGALVHFHANASDPNGDLLAYAWSFDDLTFSTNNLPWTFKSWNTPGEHVVRCVVSDMKGGVASANGVVTVGEPVGFRVSGRVTDLHGSPVQGVRVDNGGTNIADYLGGYTDTYGNYVIAGVPGDVTLNAVQYGFTITNSSGSSFVPVAANLTNVDFIALPITTVGLATSTNAVPENSSAVQYFTLTRTGDTNNDLTVSVNLSGSASVGSDFNLNPALTNTINTLIIPAGTNAVTIALQTINDRTVEGPETVTLTMLEDPAYTLAPLSEATITLLDDDPPSRPAISISALSPTILESGSDPGQFLISRTGTTTNDLTVYYSVSGTATPGTDYTALVGVAVIPANSDSTTVEFRPVDDKNVEADETVVLTISANAAYTGAGGSAQVTILDDDLLTVTIAPTGDGAAEPSSTGRFTVKRDGDVTDSLVVGYTVAGTATSGVDYKALSGSVTIPAGDTSADIVLTPLADTLLEGDESVVVTLTNTPGYDVGTPGSATLFIRDSQKVTVSITATDNTASEPGADTGLLTISRGSVVSGNLTVYLAWSGTAVNGVDYVPLDSTVVIPNGASSVDLEVIPFDDLQIEYPETVICSILSNTNYDVGSPELATVTINDDDSSQIPAVGFCFAASSAPENQSPGVCVSLSVTSTAPVTVDYRVIGGTAATNDYTLAPGPLTFAAGEWAKSIPLTINDNSVLQSNRTIRLVLFNPSGATLDGIKLHTYTILDDDATTVTVSATAPTASESGPVAGNFRISRTGATNASLLVNFQVTGTASAPTDYLPLGTSVTIPAGAKFIDLPVVPADDATVELAQTVVITLIGATAGKVGSPGSATITINDNDAETLPVVSVTSTSHPYAVEGGANGEFLFTRSTTNGGALTVQFAVSGTATSGADYTALPTSITFLAGQLSVSLPVVAVNDSQIEGDETVMVSLENHSAYRTAFPGSATVVIQDNDQNVRLDASDFIAAEPGTDTGEFTFTRFGTTNTDLRVFFIITGTAGNGVDYVAISNSFVIPAGQLSATLPIIPLDDTLVEGPETVTLTLQSNPAYTLGANITGTVTIQDDEPMLTIIASVPNVVEGSPDPGVFTIIRTGDPKYEVTAHLAIGGTATYGVDYPPILTNIYFACGVMAIDLQIIPTNELVAEGLETVTASLLPDPAYTVLWPSNAVLTIQDAGTNTAPVINITSPTVPTVFLVGPDVGIILNATVSDDGDTNSLTLNWSQVSGPDVVAFGSTNQSNTTASFTNNGVYVLRLTVDDGQLTNYAQLTVVVGATELLSTNLLHWSFDDVAGTNVFDSSGAGHHGILTGSPAWLTNGVLAGAVRLFGTNDCAQATNALSFLDGLDEFILSLWVNAAASNSDQAVFSADDSGTNGTLTLSTRTYASCGQATNVIEATVATTGGLVRRTSASNLTTNGWQHLALAWSNGLPPALFVNGRLDQPLSQTVPVAGVLTSCPQFLVGKGSAGGPPSWNGWIDDVRLFPRALNAGELAALAFLPPTNYGAVVFAGSNVTIQLTGTAVLAGQISDDGKPAPPGALSNVWFLASGPAPVTLTNANALTNTVTFSQSGQYVFRLIADDSQVMTFSDVTVTVIEPTRVDIVATDSDAAELGPDPGQVTLMRQGDINFDLPVFLAFSGTASNGVDFVTLSNVVVFATGTNRVDFVVTPFLDARTEGDETITFTIISNLSYSIGNPSATVTIHDSPYGVWNIAHFTLEQLTDPSLTGQGADFDHDGLVNFVEYAFNRDPTTPDNGVLATSIELDPNDNLNHITLTYQRRIEPTDVGYASCVSNDLFHWNTGTNFLEQIQVTDDGNFLTQTVKERVLAPFTTNANFFVTVRVWLRVTGP